MFTILAILLVMMTTTSSEGIFPPQVPQVQRILKRARKRCDRTRVGSLNCRTLLADDKLSDLDRTLTENKIILCALQEVRRDGFMSTTTEHFKVYWYCEGAGHRGV